MCASAIAGSPTPTATGRSRQPGRSATAPPLESLPGSRLGAPPVAEAAQPPPFDVVEEWGIESFPASDPPSNW